MSNDDEAMREAVDSPLNACSMREWCQALQKRAEAAECELAEQEARTLAAELAQEAAERERDEARASADAWKEKAHAHHGEWKRALGRIAALEAAVREAPCPRERAEHEGCGVCDCWKRRALEVE